jgi:TetR/AcrR family transcriptional regulator, transcriptional repressor for nem operon
MAVNASVRPASAVRQRLVEAAAGLLARRGWEACSVLDLAAVAGASKNQLFHYFAGKEALARAALEHSLGLWEMEVTTPAQAWADGFQRARYVVGRIDVALAERTPAYEALCLLAALAAAPDALPAGLRTAVEAALEAQATLLRDCAKALRQGPRSAGGLKARDAASALQAWLLGTAMLETRAPLSCSELLRRLAG